MIGLLRSEWRKIHSTRWWWLLAAAGYLGLTAAVLAAAVGVGATGADSGPDPFAGLSGAAAARLIYALGPSLGYVFPAILGALTVTTEFRHQTITPTFLAEPRRGRVLAAKLVAVLPLSAACGALVTLASVGFGAATLAVLKQPTGLGEAATWALSGRSVGAMALWGVFGVGLGVLIRHQVGAIVVLLAFTQLLEPVVRLIPLMIGRPLAALGYLPGAVGESVAGIGIYSGLTGDLAGSLPGPAAVAVLLGYGLVFAAVGYAVTWRRDVT